jgi:5-formyltetrahydrofolate cyclo-ligase
MLVLVCRRAMAAHAPTPGNDMMTQKAELRKRIKADLKAVEVSALADQSASICRHLQSAMSEQGGAGRDALQSAERIVAYLACERLREVDLSAVVESTLSARKALFVPRVNDKSSNMSMLRITSLDGLQQVPQFGIVEPTDTDEHGKPREDVIRDKALPDAVLLPGLGFDRSGGRLGRGGGYYDKFLNNVLALARELGRPRPLLVGVAFREQVVERVPMAAHDARCDAVLTPDGWSTWPLPGREGLAKW